MRRREPIDNPTASYRASGWLPASAMAAATMTGEPVFSWSEVPLMMLDGAVDFGLRTLRTPYAQIDIATDDGGQPKITGRPEVRDYILRTWRRFWRNSLPMLLERYFAWGRSPGGNEWRWDAANGRLELDTVRAIEPLDCRAHIYAPGSRREGQFAGYDLRSVGVNTFVGKPHAFWFAGAQKLGPFCDAPRLRPAFPSWLQKTAPMGLLHARRLFNWTQAVGITVIRHPGGDVPLPDGTKIPAAVRAMQIGMAIQNGSIVEMSSRMIPGPNGMPSNTPEWAIDQREPRTGGDHINKTVSDADSEIWFGMGIPTEVIRAMESGSGFAGRSIPMETWFGQADELARLIDGTFRRQTLHYGVRQNFGSAAWDYEVSSLLEDFRKQNAKPGQPGDDAASPDAARGGAGGGDSGYSPDGVSRGGRPRFTNPAGQHRYGQAVSLSGLDVPPAAGTSAPPDAIDGRTAMLRKAAALAMIEHRLREIAHSRTPDPDARDAIAELADDPDEVADALGSVSLSWINYGKSRGGKQRWKNTDTKQVRYQDRMPGTHTEERQRAQANARKGHEVIDKLGRNEATADDLRELADHLPAMTVSDLKRARARLQATFKGGRKRDQMVRALLDHVEGRRAERTAAERAGADAAPKGPKLRENGTPAEPKVEDVHTVPTASLNRRPELMQYKVSGIGSEGITDELKGVKQYKPELGGVLLAWRDPDGGDDIVVNGHHRHELADRTGSPTVNVRYLPVKTAAEARAVGAIANIAEGRGTATDAAKLMRDSGLTLEDLQKAGVSLSGRIAADAGHLKDLGPAAFQRLTEGRLDEAQAVAVAKHLKNTDLQDALFKKLEKREEEGKDWSTREIEQAAKKMAAAGRVTTSGSDLFGDWESEDSTFDQEVELEAHVGRVLNQSVNDFAAVSNVGRASRVATAGNVLVTDENQRRREEAARHAETYNVLVNRSGPIARAIKESAAELAKAKSKRERDAVKSRAVERVREAIGHELGDKPAPPVAGATGGGDSGGATSPGAAGEPGAGTEGGTGEVVHTSASGLGPVAFVPHPNQREDETTVVVDTKKLRTERDRVLAGQWAERPDKRAAVESFLQTGRPVHASRAAFGANGALDLSDGNHRLSVLADRGAETIAVTVPKGQEAEFRRRFGAGSPPAIAEPGEEPPVVLEPADADELNRRRAKARAALLSRFSPEDHPRNDAGEFVSKGAIEDARSDPAAAESLRSQVTDPGERAKLDAQLTRKPAHDAADVPEQHRPIIARFAEKASAVALDALMLFDKVGLHYSDILDTPEDFAKLGYNPGMAGTGPMVADPVRESVGIGAHLAFTVASKALAAAFVAGKNAIKKRQQPAADAAVMLSAAGGTEDAVRALAEKLYAMFAELARHMGGGDVPPIDRIERGLREITGGE